MWNEDYQEKPKKKKKGRKKRTRQLKQIQLDVKKKNIYTYEN